MAPAEPPKRFELQVSTRHSVGIELEFLVAYLRPGVKDPFESNADSLPPLLRLDMQSGEVEAGVMQHIRETLEKHGIDVAGPSTPSPPHASGIPRRLQNRDKWEVGVDSTVREWTDRRFGWVPIEVRSPALWAQDESFLEVDYVVNLLTSSYRIRINPTCGFHVHVGNGRKFFNADTIKRLGGFLWAADPMLSRLHAPWRRIGEYSTSIRYLSKLSCERGGAAEVKRQCEDELSARLNPPDPIAVTEFSDTSLEEKEHRGGWATAAAFFTKVGPFLSFGKNLDDVKDVESSAPTRGRQSHRAGPMIIDGLYPHPNVPGKMAPLQIHENDTELIIASKQILSQKLEDAIPSVDLAPEEHTQHRNLAWASWDELEDGVLQLLDQYCEEDYGHTDITQIDTGNQIRLMLQAHSTHLYNEPDYEKLSPDNRTQLLHICSKYFEVGRSSFVRNEATGRWELQWFEVGPLVEQPRAVREAKYATTFDAPYTVRKFDNLVRLMNIPDEGNDDGIEYVTQAEREGAMESSRSLEQLVEGLRDRAESPGPDYKEDVADYPHQRSPPRSQGMPGSASDHENRTESNYESSDYDSSEYESTEHSQSPPPAYGATEIPAKLKPYNVDDFPAAYAEGLHRYLQLPPAILSRIPWIPSTTHPRADPAADVAGVSTPDWDTYLVPNPRVSTVEGVYELATCNSALQVATLLQSSRGHRGNYNFDHYILDLLDYAFEADSGNPRTIEFREAEGTMDAGWIVTWMRICVGIVRFARRAPIGTYLQVLERILAQEERDLARVDALAGGAETYEFEERDERLRYDVCDLLEDVGLYAEAEFVKGHERTREEARLDQVRSRQ